MVKKIFEILDGKKRIQLVGVLVVIVINSLLELLCVSAVYPLISAVTTPSALHERKMFLILRDILHIEEDQYFIACLALIIALFYIIKNLYVIWMNSVFYRFTSFSQRDLAVKMTECYLNQDYAFHVEHNLAEIQRNVENDVSCLFTTILNILQLLAELLVCLLLVIYLAFTDILTTLVVALLMSALLAVLLLLMRKKMKYYGEQNRITYEARTRWFFQSFGGIKEIKTAGKEDYFLNGYRTAYSAYSKIFYQRNVLAALTKPVVEMVCIGGIMIFMAIRIWGGEDLEGVVPVLAVFAVAAFRLMPSFNRISAFVNNIIFNKAAVAAVHRDLKEMSELEQKRRETKQETLSFEKELKISDLHFHYSARPEKEVLDGVNLTVPFRRSVAFVGPSGAGKTTLADIILGIYKPVSGSVTVDGKDVHRNPDSWHGLVAYIPQSIYLMDDSIRANVAFGIPKEEIDDAQIWEALREAQLEEFVRQQPEGLDSRLGDRGVKLSGGQRQRVGIARALYTKPQLLVLDEATSALDSETESAVMDAIYRLSRKVTMIVIAHRITTIKSCDEIFRIEGGRAEKISYEEAERGAAAGTDS